MLALAHGFHPSTLFLQPAMAFLVWWLWRRRGEPVAQVLAAWLLPVLVVLAGVLALMTAGGHGLDAFLGPEAPGGGDHRWWVPLSQPTGEWEYYTLFSRGHLMDILNEQWLTQPFTLVTLALLLIFFWRTWPRDAYSGFLFLAAGAYLFLIFTWNPDYGGQRDWDLFSTAAWPATHGLLAHPHVGNRGVAAHGRRAHRQSTSLHRGMGLCQHPPVGMVVRGCDIMDMLFNSSPLKEMERCWLNFSAACSCC